QPIFREIEHLLRLIACKMKGDYYAFPTCRGFTSSEGFSLNKKAITSHPLGGCVMGNDADEGVVNTSGQVFKCGASRADVYDGLYVMDGSTVPGPLAVNPTYTIVALSIKMMDRIQKI